MECFNICYIHVLISALFVVCVVFDIVVFRNIFRFFKHFLPIALNVLNAVADLAYVKINYHSSL